MSKLYWLEVVHLCGLKLALNQSLQQGLKAMILWSNLNE